jgi:uncharacterized secreted protein with C-terminal beta-propeller domain
MKIITGVSIVALFSACGGGSQSSDEGRQEQAYLAYWKQSLSDVAGANYVIDGERRLVDELAAEANGDAMASRSYSTTNVQVQGVDELDLIEFDSEVLLTLNQSYVWDYWSRPERTELRAYNLDTLEGVEPEDRSLHRSLPDSDYRGLTTQGEHVALISSTFAYDYWEAAQFCINCMPEQTVEMQFWQYKSGGRAQAPTDVQSLTVEGEYIDVRAMNGKLYLVSSYFPTISGLNMYPENSAEKIQNQEIIDAIQSSDLQPSIVLNGEAISPLPDNCRIPEDSAESSYDLPRRVTILEIDMQDPSNIRSACALGRTSGIFMSTDNIYLFESDYYDVETEILKFSVSETGPSYEASGRISGINRDSYFYGEVDGRLVVVNSVWDEVNWWSWDERHQLQVLEQQGSGLELVSTLPNATRPEPIGKPGEQIYALRIFGDRAYVVTFDKVDPLYVIDLSNTEDPQVLGELEIPGYSAYLHPVSEDLVLGLGKNAVISEGMAWFQGLNLRLFDVSDPTAPVAVENMDFGLRGSESELLYDPHALAYLADNQSGMARLSIPMHLTLDDANSGGANPPWTYYDQSETGLFQFELDIANKRMTEVARYIHSRRSDDGWYSSYGDRSVINGDSIYYAHGDELDVLEWGSSELIRSFSVEAPED